MVNVAFELGNQVNEELEYSENLDSIKYDSLLIMGMGGSGVAGDVYCLLSDETTSKNVMVRKTYSIPEKLISKKPFCLFISYSGNTEETISGINDAISNELDWAVISSGGKLISYAEKHKKPYIKIPKGLQPRAAFGYLTQAVCKYIDLVENTNYLDEIKAAGEYLNNILEEKNKLGKKLFKHFDSFEKACLSEDLDPKSRYVLSLLEEKTRSQKQRQSSLEEWF